MDPETTTPVTTTATTTTKSSSVGGDPSNESNSKPTKTNGRSKSHKVAWPSDEKINKVHHFEYIADERVNVSRSKCYKDPRSSKISNASVISSPGDAKSCKKSMTPVDPTKRTICGNIKTTNESSDRAGIEYFPWRSLIPIDFIPEILSPGWNNSDRSALAERETFVLSAIDSQDQPSILAEPDSPIIIS